MTNDFSWWQHGVFYQIYPRSFMDSNGDGIGDLQGIIDKLDYLAGLGVNAIWISPIFQSPMVDFGYDVSDYTAIHPMFGDLTVFDTLIADAHARNLKIILDYVPNHSSDQHPWFLESRSSRDNPKRDWYIWRDAKPDSGPPNNWECVPGGSAWEWDERTGQYYLHSFIKEQPDLNWHNPDVVEAMHEVLRFWLRRGVDGFRMDMLPWVIKHPDFPDNPPLPADSPLRSRGLKLDNLYNSNQPQLHTILRDFRKLFDSYGDRIIIGETPIFDPVQLATYYGEDLDEIQMPFNFMSLFDPWDAPTMKATIERYYAALPKGALPNFVFGNHDFPRLATRFGHQNLRSAAMLLLTTWGIPTIYYGEELGMENVSIPPEKMQDPVVNRPRDPERTPMQWDATANAGFTPADVEPWLPVSENFEQINVAVEAQDPSSTLNYYKQLLKLRREMPALHRGVFTFVEGFSGDLLGYFRQNGREKVMVALNFGAEEQVMDLSPYGENPVLLLSTEFREIDLSNLRKVTLHPHESALFKL